jgi:hypothetical protein
MDSSVMRKAAKRANVSWNYQPVIYKSMAIGFSNANSEDLKVIKNELENILGYQPVGIDESTINNQTD